MPRFVAVPVLVTTLAAALFPFGAAIAATTPSPTASTIATNKDAGTFDGVVTAVVYTAGSSSMTVKTAGQTTTFAVNPGTNVKGPSNDFTVDVKVGARVSVSASKNGTAYTAQIVRVVPAKPAH